MGHVFFIICVQCLLKPYKLKFVMFKTEIHQNKLIKKNQNIYKFMSLYDTKSP